MSERCQVVGSFMWKCRNIVRRMISECGKRGKKRVDQVVGVCTHNQLDLFLVVIEMLKSCCRTLMVGRRKWESRKIESGRWERGEGTHS